MSMIIQILVLICTFYFNQVFVSCQCPEADPDELPFLDQRIANNTKSTTVSDRFLPTQWYSVLGTQGQFQMVDSNNFLSVSKSCGTNFPVYLKEPHPSLDSITEDPTTVTACLLTFDSACAAEYSVEIRKCNEILQYKMEQTRSIAAYCFELKTPIDDIEFPDDEAKPVTVEVKPTLQYFVYEDFQGNTINAPRLVFKCDFTIQDNYFYRVYWYINGIFINMVKGPVQKANAQDLNIEEDEIIALGYGLGINLRCGVRVSNDENSILTEVTESEDFFAGIKLIDKQVTLNKSEENKSFQFQSTVPLGCKHIPGTVGSCTHEIYMVDANKTTEYTCTTSTVATNTFDKCGIDLEISYDPIENFIPKMYSMRVKVTDVTYGDPETFTLLLRTSEFGGGHTIWTSYLIDYLTVLVLDDGLWHNRVCYAIIDPHEKTADGRSFENQNGGEFIFYRNQNYKLEVQEKTEACWSNGAYCTCAVTVRAGGDIFTVNICGGVKVIDFLSCDDNVLDVRVLSNKQTYRVYTPIGTYVEIQLRSGFINLYVYVSPKDLYNVDGLCGNFDGQSGNDFVKRTGIEENTSFQLSWRITAAESLLTHANTIDLDRYGKEYMFCVCEPVGTQLSNTATCSVSNNQLCTRNLEFPDGSIQKSCKITGKRSTEANAYMQEIWRKIELSKIHDENIADIRKRRSIETIEMSDVSKDAYTNCSKVLKNSFAALNVDAASRLGDNLNATILACAYDITATGGEINANVHNDMINQELDNFYQKAIKYTTANPDTFKEFKDQTCEGNCYGHGTCSNGLCTCETGFRGAFCNIDITTPIDVEAIQYDGLCDKNIHAECDGCITIQTDTLTADFICKRTIKQTLSDGSVVTDEYVKAGQQEDIFNGYCCKQDKRKKRSTTSAPSVFVSEYEISISNDGLNFGTALSVFEYDSTCQSFTEVNGTRSFYLKPGYCIIEGSCVDVGAVSGPDACMTCLSQTDQYGSTPGCESSSNSNGNNTVLIVGVCVLVMLLGYF